MPRVKTGTVRRARHKKVLKLAKGYYGTRNRLFKRAQEAVLRAGQHAYIGRKNRKRDFRTLWIQRINAAVRQLDATNSYSQFMHNLKQAKIEINRKMLAELAVNDFTAFTKVFETARGKK